MKMFIALIPCFVSMGILKKKKKDTSRQAYVLIDCFY